MNFSKNSHPSIEQISGLIDLNDDGDKAINDHVTGCAECSSELKTLKHSISRLRLAYNGEEILDTSKHLDDDVIKEYVKEKTDEAKVKAHIAECDTCRQAVLLYRAQRIEHINKNRSIETEKQTGFEDHIERLVSALKWKNDWAVPFWLGIPLGAVASILIVMLLFFVTPKYNSGNSILVTYRDDPFLYWMDASEKGQSLGFFTASPVDKVKFEHVKLRQLDKSTIQIQWPFVEDVTSYKVTIYQATTPKPLLIYETKTKNNSLDIELEFMPGQRYIWQISGLKENLRFNSQGGFLLSIQD